MNKVRSWKSRKTAVAHLSAAAAGKSPVPATTTQIQPSSIDTRLSQRAKDQRASTTTMGVSCNRVTYTGQCQASLETTLFILLLEWALQARQMDHRQTRGISGLRIPTLTRYSYKRPGTRSTPISSARTKELATQTLKSGSMILMPCSPRSKGRKSRDCQNRLLRVCKYSPTGCRKGQVKAC